MKKYLIIAIVILVAGVAIFTTLNKVTSPTVPAETASSTTAGWQTYKNEQYGFEFQYPATEPIKYWKLGVTVGSVASPNFTVSTSTKKGYVMPATLHSEYVFKYQVSSNSFVSQNQILDEAPITGKCPSTYSLNGINTYVAFLSGSRTGGPNGNDDSDYTILTNKDYIIDIDFSDYNIPEINKILSSFKLIGDTTSIQANCSR